MEFKEDDRVYLKISPMKEVIRFLKKGKLSPRYVGPYEILQWFYKVAYKLKLPSELAVVHPVFHVSMLKKCIGDSMSILSKDNLSYEEVRVQLLDRQYKKFRKKKWFP